MEHYKDDAGVVFGDVNCGRAASRRAGTGRRRTPARAAGRRCGTANADTRAPAARTDRADHESKDLRLSSRIPQRMIDSVHDLRGRSAAVWLAMIGLPTSADAATWPRGDAAARDANAGVMEILAAPPNQRAVKPHQSA